VPVKKMIETEFEYLNKLLAILDSCKADMIVNLSSTWNEEDYDGTKNVKALKIQPYLDSKRNLIINRSQKEEVIGILAHYFTDADYYHYKIISENKLIGIGYDSCNINFLHPEYFTLNEDHFKILDDSEVVFRDHIKE
jgi:hypothetical protein